MKRPTVRLDKEVRDRAELYSRDMGLLMPKAYCKLIDKGLDYYKDDGFTLPDKIPHECVVIQVEFEGHTLRRVKFFSKRHQLRRPIAYYLLIRKGLEVAGY